MAKNIVTPEQEIYFFNKVEEYQVMLNLQNWRIERVDKLPNQTSLAEVHTSPKDRAASIILNKNWKDVTITKQKLSELALHECLHVFFREFEEAVSYGDEDLSYGVEHSMVIVLSKLLVTQ